MRLQWNKAVLFAAAMSTLDRVFAAPTASPYTNLVTYDATLPKSDAPVAVAISKRDVGSEDLSKRAPIFFSRTRTSKTDKQIKKLDKKIERLNTKKDKAGTWSLFGRTRSKYEGKALELTKKRTDLTNAQRAWIQGEQSKFFANNARYQSMDVMPAQQGNKLIDGMMGKGKTPDEVAAAKKDFAAATSRVEQEDVLSNIRLSRDKKMGHVYRSDTPDTPVTPTTPTFGEGAL